MLWQPSINVREDQDAFHIEAELPGVNPDDVDISLEDRVLTISGEKRSDTSREEESYHVAERSYGRFERSFTLARSVDPDAIEARYDRGVLLVTIPKPEEQKPRRIQIRADAGQRPVESAR
jgi:HSP20 family protein